MAKSIGDKLLARLAKLHAGRMFRRFMRDAARARAVQDRLLTSLVGANASSDYGQAHGFASIRGYADFVRQIPITRYDMLKPYVERVMAGETSAMFGDVQRVHMFAMTSGTVDEPKYVPVTDRFMAEHRAGWNAFGAKALSDHPDALVRYILQVTSPMDEERAAGGLPCGAITGMMARNQKRIVRKYYITPPEVAYISDTTARRYTIMRLAMPADVSWIVTASPATVLQLARIGDAESERIIRDVRDGTLSADMDIPSDVRQALAPRLTADTAAADRLARLRSEWGRLYPRDYWNLGFLANWTGGTMGLYLQDFPEYFGDVPVRDIGLLATEGRMSLPIEDGTASGVAMVSSVFLEFIPAEQYGREDPDVLRCHEVEVGREYFLLLTNSAGFYRYDIGDCVRVTGFVGEAPLIAFLNKGAHISSVAGEKITEHQVVSAFERAAAACDPGSREFVLAPRWGQPPCYRLFVEPDASQHVSTLEPLADVFDRVLSEMNIEYASKRSSGRLGDVELVTLQTGAMADLHREQAHRYRASNEQFKHRYLLTHPGEDEALMAMAVGEKHGKVAAMDG